ncbi:stage II sporulation protein P [Paenibacillus alkalitolerans]|uniref:stage II sporulation protein P n=1 Tax=Paenibacillus alkalitolerans TaxID=2799335 RepID=UPI0018F4C9DC|nr:stage II sporulation protein P [Paenibacillus alkalitolerans]
MKQNKRLHWTFTVVVLLMVIGLAGYLRSHAFQSPLDTIKKLASAASDTFVSGLVDSQIAGADARVQTVLHRKNSPDKPAETPQTAENEEKAAVRNGGSQAPQPETAAKPQDNVSANASTTDRKIVFIYHSHNRESWLPELKGTSKDKPSEAFDDTTNVTLLGGRLQKKLEELGVGAVHSGKDYPSQIPAFNYNYSYKYSQKTVREALAVYSDLMFLFDIHRDAIGREHTTVRINNKNYAQMYFIIGKGNPNWKENEAFARQIDEKMNKALPGISKGIMNKGAKHGHGEYNQSLSTSSVLIEVGGYENTLEESNRTIDTLAKVIAEIAKSAKRADAPAQVASAADPS